MPAIDQYLRSPPPGYALLISGPWGAGKSHYWANRSSNPLSKITFSAAGLTTSADLERALFQASISNFGFAPLAETSALISRAAMRWVKIEPNDIKLKAEVKSGSTVVCIDDVERFSGKFRTLFGFIVNLIDEYQLHCILIADEAQANQRFGKSYSTYRERIIGKTLPIQPDLRAFCDLTIKGFSSQRSRDILDANLEFIVDTCAQRGIKNLRTIRFMLNEFESILRELPSELPPETNVESLFLAIAFWAVASSKNHGNLPIIAKAFSNSDIGIAIALHERGPKKAKDGEPDDLERLIALLKFTRFDDCVDIWPSSIALQDHINGLPLDCAALAHDFKLIAPGEVSVDMDALDRVRDYRNISDRDLRSLIPSLEAEILQATATSATRIWNIFRQLYWFCELGISIRSPEEWASIVATHLESYPITKITDSNVEFWTGPFDENETLVVAALEELIRRCNDEAGRISRIAAVENLVAGSEALPDPLRGPLFIDADPRRVRLDLQTKGVDAVVRFSRFFQQRMHVSNAADFVGADQQFAKELAMEIETQVPLSRPMSILSAELRELARLLRAFVAKVEATSA